MYFLQNIDIVTKEADSSLRWKSESTPYLYHSPSLNNFEQIQFKNILFEQVPDPCCLECHINLCLALVVLDTGALLSSLKLYSC